LTTIKVADLRSCDWDYALRQQRCGVLCMMRVTKATFGGLFPSSSGSIGRANRCPILEQELTSSACLLLTARSGNHQTRRKQRFDRGRVVRFPNELCTDRGRAINQREPGWEKTLTGYPKELYDFWQKHLKARGYKVGFQIVDFPGGRPGDIGITIEVELTFRWLHFRKDD
jgi:hypothetical protein